MQIFGGGGIGSRRLAPEEGSGSSVLGGKGALVTMGGNGDGEVFSVGPNAELNEIAGAVSIVIGDVFVGRVVFSVFPQIVPLLIVVKTLPDFT